MGCTIEVTVVPNAKVYKICKDKRRNGIKVYVKSKAQEGKANRDLLIFLSLYLRNPLIVSGQRSRNKIISVENEKEEILSILERLIVESL